MDKQKKVPTVQNKQFQQLTQQLNERRTANHKLQAQNSALNSEITYVTYTKAVFWPPSVLYSPSSVLDLLQINMLQPILKN